MVGCFVQYGISSKALEVPNFESMLLFKGGPSLTKALIIERKKDKNLGK